MLRDEAAQDHRSKRAQKKTQTSDQDDFNVLQVAIIRLAVPPLKSILLTRNICPAAGRSIPVHAAVLCQALFRHAFATPRVSRAELLALSGHVTTHGIVLCSFGEVLEGIHITMPYTIGVCCLLTALCGLKALFIKLTCMEH